MYKRKMFSRKTIFCYFVLIFILISGLGIFFCGRFYAAESPNIILVSIDALRADHLGCYGYVRKTSPNIDALAKEGTIFLSAYSHSPKTTPSHMSIMTSLHHDVHKVNQVARDRVGKRIDPAVTTLAEILKKRGYTTIGFVGGGNVAAYYGFDKGFDIYERGAIGGVLSWLDNNFGKKFFIFFHTYAVHDPYLPPPAYNRMYDKTYAGKVIDSAEKIRPQEGRKKVNWQTRHAAFWASVNKEDQRDIDFLVAQYDAEINYVDNEMIKPLLEKLKSCRIYKDTLIIFTSDHGEAFAEHNNFMHDDLFVETLHVPLIIVYPKFIPKNKVITQLVRLTDIMPTVLDIACIKNKALMQGRSLLPAILENKILGLSCYSSYPDMKSIRTENYAFIENSAKDGKVFWSLLYNRKQDPRERQDIAISSFSAVDKLKKQLYEEIGFCERLSGKYRVFDAGPLDQENRERLESLGYL